MNARKSRSSVTTILTGHEHRTAKPPAEVEYEREAYINEGKPADDEEYAGVINGRPYVNEQDA